MDILTWIIVIVIGLILLKVVGKILKFAIGIGLVLLILYVLSSVLTNGTISL
ncbi:hypothetical protein [Evansella halocellulosilytica]|uniref:hypothetical protein n=1 Tax=Evansella halocellulosilytica TaxID=2011013 RepID=UPI0015CB93B6|nr:hypothetical protein [Evansella halocellulosilytica]